MLLVKYKNSTLLLWDVKRYFCSHTKSCPGQFYSFYIISISGVLECQFWLLCLYFLLRFLLCLFHLYSCLGVFLDVLFKYSIIISSFVPLFAINRASYIYTFFFQFSLYFLFSLRQLYSLHSSPRFRYSCKADFYYYQSLSLILSQSKFA